MTANPFKTHDTQGVVAVNSPDYLRHMLGNLTRGVVSVPLRGADDHERLMRTDTARSVTPDSDTGWLDMGFVSKGDDALAQISFTSGTQGAAKAVYLSRANLHDVVTRLNDAMQVTSEIREYIGVPVYHSFGYGRARAVLHAGGQCFVPEAGFNVTQLRDMLERGEVNAISAVPSLWRVFLQSVDMFGDALSAVRWVEIGSQYMSPEDKLALREALPNARIIQHYGLTEASRSSFLQVDGTQAAHLSSVGRAVGDVRLDVSQAGRILIKGPHVALGVDDGTTFVPHDPDDWFETSDLGRLEDGLLYYEGRADDVINLSGLKISPDLVEAHVRNTLDLSGDFGVLRRPDGLRGEAVLVVMTPQAMPQKDAILAEIDAYLKLQGVTGRGAVSIQMRDDLPRTATGKLQRAAIEIDDTGPQGATALPGFAGQIGDILGLEGWQGTEHSFDDLDGDSLSHMQMTLALERAFGAAPPNWEHTALSALAAQADAMPPGGKAAGPGPLPRGEHNMNPPDLGFWQLVREDFLTNGARLSQQGFWMLFVHRFGNWRMDVRPRLLRLPLSILYKVLNKLTELCFGMKLSYTVKVGRRVKLEHFGGMILGAREIGNDVTLRQNTTMGIRTQADLMAKPVLGNFVDVGAGAVIVGNITVGRNSIIGANTVVFSNVPPNAVVMGVPGKIIGTNPGQNPSPLKDRFRKTRAS